ncbi:CDP-Glycerol:Poly(Glycerophosphate) glycerophosphotransferase [Flavobacterium sp. 9R]|uniref:CDP-glycerol glycerophosphotransferase family protein n=1 Tax=Flavobacterium sp. 9R TaxID=2653143 RepID=UPI0012F1E857|nr:CDP-glycerol glycerophosphotransferase family protein [Flavobacterium sp. 9R]VXA96427.1 CDP-Glycerol:Poly(Glycerophosphate) glycerophosphotransferase [Flavobacterium sp. 9R]
MSSLKSIIKAYAPTKVWEKFGKVKGLSNRLYEFYLIKTAPARHRKALIRIRKKEKIKVAFFLIHDSVWKYDILYNLMVEHTKFEPVIFVCPVVNFGFDNMVFQMEKSFDLFQSKNYNVIKTFNKENGTYLDVKMDFSPDIVFYTNPYESLQDDRYFIKQFKNTLTCYVPYAVMTTKYDFFYTSAFHDLVWKIFSETTLHKDISSKKQKNKGSNIIVTGYPGFDEFLVNQTPNNDVWKNKNPNLKKIIWAPHHLMNELNRMSNFLEYCDFFLDLAIKYHDKIQIAFKPHPLLRVKLENDPNWGKDKTDKYYEYWENLPNGQFESAEYGDLFLTSDALIHDCGSFISEYLFTMKPTLFMVRNENVMKMWSEYGEKALSVHYQSRTNQELEDFIESVVLNGSDRMEKERREFVNNILMTENKLTASENIMGYLENEIFTKKNI